VVSNHSAGARFHARTLHYGGPVPEQESFPRQLRRAGFDTISFSNFADRHYGMWFAHGWSEMHTPNLKRGGETAEQVNAPLLRWLKHNATRENYLLHINYWDAHRLYKMDPSWADRFADTPPPDWPDEEAFERLNRITGPFTGTGQFRDHRSLVPLMPGKITNRKEFVHAVTGYDAAIAYVDHHVGIVLEELDRQGVLEDAVVLITADHGDAFGEHGIFTDHVCADACIHHIPLIVRTPGVTPPGGTDDAMLYNVDLSPTLCELLGAEIPAGWDGRSFGENLRGRKGLRRDALVWGHALYTVQRAVRTGRHLVIRTYDAYGYPFEPVELYDMQADPYPTRNLRDEQPQTVAECQHIMDVWVSEQRAAPDTIGDPFEAVLAERRAHGGA